MYHLTDLDTSRQSYTSLPEKNVFLACKFSRKTAIKLQKCFCLTLFQKFVTDCHLEHFRLSNYRPMKRNLEFREQKTYFKKHIFINVQQNIPLRTIEWLRDTTNALEQEESLLNKGLNNSFLNDNGCFFVRFKNLWTKF